MNTQDCIQYLIAKYGKELSDGYLEASLKNYNDEWYNKHYAEMAKKCLNPKYWKRLAKYKINDANEKYKGGIYRDIMLTEGDGAARYGLIEFNGQIVEEIDLSD